LYYGLFYDDGTYRSRAAHRLVLEAHHGLAPAGCVASHVNGDRTDNRLTNLVWESPTANERRKREHGTAPLGERQHSAKLSALDVRHIRAAAARGVPQVTLARLYAVRPETVYRIVRQRAWREEARTGKEASDAE
jgi:HNH endonuclease